MGTISRLLITAAIISISFFIVPAPASAQVSVGVDFGNVGLFVNVAPPPVPVYYAPAPPGPGYVWIPGYWAWGPGGYYWVPGYWNMAPQVGFYWTPGYWGWDPSCGCYDWQPGYWGPQVGFYGGIDYGYGYYGNGYVGGYWRNRHFWYNTAVYGNVGYGFASYRYRSDRGVLGWRGNRVAYNGGPGGDPARPTRSQLAFRQGRHVGMTYAQVQHARVASQDRLLYARYNHGRPAVAAVARPFAGGRRPTHFAPLRAQDRTYSAAHVVRSPSAYHAMIMHHTAITHRTTTRAFHRVTHMVTHRTTTRTYHAPPYHPAYHAPAYHPVYHAPAYHPAYHAAAYHPAYHAPAYHAPAYHPAPLRPAGHRAPAPRRSAAPRSGQ